MALQPGVRLGPYEIQSALGAGGMGEVYKANDTRLDRGVAIKILPEALAADPQFRERFDREARTISQLEHPHICALYDVGEQDGSLFLVMQYLEGETLQDRLVKGALRLDEALTIAIQIASALDKAHRAGVTHRDLKPGNIMLTKAGAQLLDFGLAKASRPVVVGTGVSMLPTTPPNLTAQGTILGTFQYMAPEQLEGHDADARSDIFAFGAVVYEMLTGKHAFDGKSHASLIGAILKDTPPPMSSLQPATPTALDRVIQTCLAKDPDDRWQTARDLLRELRWIQEAAAHQRSSDSLPGPPLRSRSARLAWTVAAVSVAAAITFAMLYERRPQAEPEPVVRLTLLPPEGVTPVSSQPPEIAPDGRRVAMVGTDASGKRLIWIRALDSDVAFALPGTDRAAWPFWSPDSHTIGFFSDSKLMTVEASGHTPPQTIGAVNAGFGGTWSERGVVLFAPTTTGVLYRVPATGGVPSLVTTLHAGELSHTYPQFLDDHRFIFYVQSSRPDANGTYVADLEQPERSPTRLISTLARFVRTASSGRTSLLFARNGSLMAQAFDTEALRLTGEAAPIAARVLATGNGVLGAVIGSTASTTGVIAYVSGGEARDALTWFDRSGNRLGTLGPPGRYRDPSFSPDGRTLAVARTADDGGALSLWLIDIARPTTPSRFTFGEENARFPNWSPDGRTLAFAASAKDGVAPYLKSVGEAAAHLLPQDGSTYPFDWSRDGRFLLMQVQKTLGNFDVSVMTLADRRLQPFIASELDERSPKFSPDGRWVAYTANESGPYDVFVRSFPGGEQKHRISTQGGVRPLWRRDGRELFFLGLDGKLMAASVKPGATFEWAPPQALFQTPVDTVALLSSFQYAVVPDGQRFLFVAPAQDTSTSVSLVLNWTAGLKK